LLNGYQKLAIIYHFPTQKNTHFVQAKDRFDGVSNNRTDEVLELSTYATQKKKKKIFGKTHVVLDCLSLERYCTATAVIRTEMSSVYIC
jgi:hypothetical protein